MTKVTALFLLSLTYVIAQEDPLSCVDRCNIPYNPSDLCHCNTQCTIYSNCCADYDELCTGLTSSCINRCSENFDRRNECHCDDLCKDKGNCCPDFDDFCPNVYEQLTELANDLYYNDINAATQYDVTYDYQTHIPDHNVIEDVSPDNLFKFFNESLFDIPSYKYMRDIFDNYIRYTGTPEDVTQEELDEVKIFLDEVMESYVMKKAHEYLVEKGLVDPDYYVAFRQDLETIWFEMYTRSSGPIDSSGFEHVFIGEIKNNAVSGFHGWLMFYLEEKAGLVNYHGFTSMKEPDTLGLQFHWDGYNKKISSIFTNRSPEFELAIFTVCFKQFPNQLCKFDMAGFPVSIQTWKQNDKYIGSAYVVA
ncbi:uridylate-specific endoribonuclease-like [Ptychodera flava]|uniref:uridylate-specific endoribonuclease-like n=1 Tax=Ptychodera flava TaxID=63121 RepID=UPI003969C73F